MTDRERLIELIHKCDIMSIPTEKFTEGFADYLLENGVIVIDEKTALAMNAGASAIEKSEYLMMADYVYNPFEKPKEISYRRAAEILRELAEKALKEREQK